MFTKYLNLDDPKSRIGTAIWILGTALVTLIPLWIYLLMNFFLQPTGFWERMVLIGVGTYFLGGTQIILLVVGLCLIYNTCKSHKNACRKTP